VSRRGLDAINHNKLRNVCYDFAKARVMVWFQAFCMGRTGVANAFSRDIRETKRRIVDNCLYIKDFILCTNFDPMFHDTKCHGERLP
jgi:hypothetical protein